MKHSLWTKFGELSVHWCSKLTQSEVDSSAERTKATNPASERTRTSVMERHKGARARYQADHDAATIRDIPNVSSITPIEGDGEFVFTFTHPLLTSPSVLDIRVVPQEYSSYPYEHFFLVFACGNEVPNAVAKILEDFAATSSGTKVNKALDVLSTNISTAIENQYAQTNLDDEEEDAVMTDLEDKGTASEDDEDDEFEDFEYGDEPYDDEIFGLGTSDATNRPSTFGQDIVPERVRRIRRDFRSAREAGFLVSRVCGFSKATDNNIVSISVKVDKLCLPEETRHAWNIRTDDYILLLIRYDRYYTTFAEALDRVASASNIDFRLRKCNKYKATIEQATNAFLTQTSNGQFSHTPSNQPPDLTVTKGTDMALLGVGESIDTFMGKEFLPMLKIRHGQNLSWDDAKTELQALSSMLHHQQLGSLDNNRAQKRTSSAEDDDHVKLPGFIAKDHLFANDEVSLPLVAVQFAMRYFVRCTDYCMVCHQKVESNFEALKPYVCGRPLCLFQYMNMGFGPSIDLEVQNQPNVVDVLVSFCYAGLSAHASASTLGLREFPTGLNIQIPQILPLSHIPEGTPQQVVIDGAKLLDPIPGIFTLRESFITLDSPTDIHKVKEGNWVTVVVPITSKPSMRNVLRHGRVERMAGNTIFLRISSTHTLPISTLTDGAIPSDTHKDSAVAYLLPYNKNLDDIDLGSKAFALTILLAATPSVSSMREYLQTSQHRQLDQWERLVPSASKLLRWIIASNRSYIVQVDDIPDEISTRAGPSLGRPDERVSGVDGWIQFRFAQGSPEKEVQFQEELKNVGKPQKTILGWHGSALRNWHSIIREGLNFDIVLNGRAYGNGVYFARDFDVSSGYTRTGLNELHDASQATTWPNSALKISHAVSMSEIVNRPKEFVNVRNDWCYVVNQVHWIQCRYLFVKPATEIPLATQSADKAHSEDEFIQDPEYVAWGAQHSKLFVPKVAISSSQKNASKQSSLSLKKEAIGHVLNGGDEDPADLVFLLSDDEEDEPTTPLASTQTLQNSAQSPTSVPLLHSGIAYFQPGTLDLSKLPRLAPPDYATSQGQKTIRHEIKKLQKVQATTPMHELGWYIDFNDMTNMFHWIVELHSFDPGLQLTKDMKEAGVSSIVLEIRFGREFPMSPPFLRVIRPRFLAFGSGGGGHVTIGGAMCMELLTNSGWSPANSLESVLVQVRAALCSEDPRPARLEQTNRDYSITEAYDAYTRAARAHGWQVPNDLQEATTAMMPQVLED